MAINVEYLTDPTTGVITKAKASLDLLSSTITEYETVLEDIGTNNEYELFQEIAGDMDFIKNTVDLLIYRMYQIHASGFENYKVPDSEYGEYNGIPPLE